MTYDNGLLKILHNGTHEINSPTHIIHRFLSTQEKSIRLATLSAKERKSSKSLKQSKRNGKGADNFANSDDGFGMDVDCDLTICETRGMMNLCLLMQCPIMICLTCHCIPLFECLL